MRSDFETIKHATIAKVVTIFTMTNGATIVTETTSEDLNELYDTKPPIYFESPGDAMGYLADCDVLYASSSNED